MEDGGGGGGEINQTYFLNFTSYNEEITSYLGDFE